VTVFCREGGQEITLPGRPNCIGAIGVASYDEREYGAVGGPEKTGGGLVLNLATP
jgi:hypothetical protein